MNETKAIVATAVSLTTAAASWLSAIEAVLRISASCAAIAAGLAAFAFWRAKTKNLNRKD